MQALGKTGIDPGMEIEKRLSTHPAVGNLEQISPRETATHSCKKPTKMNPQKRAAGPPPTMAV
jgi:hypothetical protein